MDKVEDKVETCQKEAEMLDGCGCGELFVP